MLLEEANISEGKDFMLGMKSACWRSVAAPAACMHMHGRLIGGLDQTVLLYTCRVSSTINSMPTCIAIFGRPACLYSCTGTASMHATI